jgi:hypothetical protein
VKLNTKLSTRRMKPAAQLALLAQIYYELNVLGQISLLLFSVVPMFQTVVDLSRNGHKFDYVVAAKPSSTTAADSSTQAADQKLKLQVNILSAGVPPEESNTNSRSPSKDTKFASIVSGTALTFATKALTVVPSMAVKSHYSLDTPNTRVASCDSGDASGSSGDEAV